MSTRTYNALRGAGISSIDELTKFSPARIMALRNIGTRALGEIDSVRALMLAPEANDDPGEPDHEPKIAQPLDEVIAAATRVLGVASVKRLNGSVKDALIPPSKAALGRSRAALQSLLTDKSTLLRAVRGTAAASRWMDDLCLGPRSEATLFGALASTQSAALEIDLGRAALMVLGARPLFNCRTEWVEPWWTVDTATLAGLLDDVAAVCPATDDEILAVIRARGWPDELPLESFLTVDGNNVRRDPVDRMWRVRPLVPRLRDNMLAETDERTMAIMVARRTATLDNVGATYGVTRERIRQVEARGDRALSLALQAVPDRLGRSLARMLDCVAVAEMAVLELMGGTSGPEESEFARLLLDAMSASQVKDFAGQRLDGWWAMDENRLTEVLSRHVSYFLPCVNERLLEVCEQFGIPTAMPIPYLLADRHSPFRYNARTGAWVRRSCADRDAFYFVLDREGEPMRLDDLADLLSVGKHALTELLRRDDRFVIVPYSGKVALSAWDSATVEAIKRGAVDYESTLEAVVAVLRQRVSLRRVDLCAAVRDRYAVSDAAVTACLVHEAIGRWPDGTYGLTAAGAIREDEVEPRQPASTVRREGDRFIGVDLDVTANLLKGFSTQVSRWVTWMAGLRVAPRTRDFVVPGYGQVTLRRGVNGNFFSGMRHMAGVLGLQEGCAMRIWLDTRDDLCGVESTCPDHAGHPPVGSVPPR
jgi:Bacterial RNA polymerase, alpha chain C terminal domain